MGDNTDPQGGFADLVSGEEVSDGVFVCQVLVFFCRRLYYFILHATPIPVPSTESCTCAQQRTAAVFIVCWRRGCSGRPSASPVFRPGHCHLTGGRTDGQHKTAAALGSQSQVNGCLFSLVRPESPGQEDTLAQCNSL